MIELIAVVSLVLAVCVGLSAIVYAMCYENEQAKQNLPLALREMLKQ